MGTKSFLFFLLFSFIAKAELMRCNWGDDLCLNEFSDKLLLEDKVDDSLKISSINCIKNNHCENLNEYLNTNRIGPIQASFFKAIIEHRRYVDFLEAQQGLSEKEMNRLGLELSSLEGKLKAKKFEGNEKIKILKGELSRSKKINNEVLKSQKELRRKFDQKTNEKNSQQRTLNEIKDQIRHQSAFLKNPYFYVFALLLVFLPTIILLYSNKKDQNTKINKLEDIIRGGQSTSNILVKEALEEQQSRFLKILKDKTTEKFDINAQKLEMWMDELKDEVEETRTMTDDLPPIIKKENSDNILFLN